MKATPENLAERYRRALQDHLEGAGEASLKRAYDLGRQALDNGLGVLEITALLQRALAEVVAVRHPGEGGANTIRLAQDFLVETLSPFEMTHRGSKEVNTALRRLNERLNEKLEETARKIASALHDEAWQLMAVVHVDLYLASQSLPEPARQHLQKVKSTLKELEQNLRRLSHEIRPKILDDLGVVAAVNFLAKGISERTGIPITVEGPGDERFPAVIETNIYRIAQEALINSSRHSQATQADVVIQSRDGRVTCSIRDNGIGFNLEEVLTRTGHMGLGLLGIQERVTALGGTLKINSKPGKGTDLLVELPLARIPQK